MIHNPEVNNDLLRRGIEFIMDTDGQMLMDWAQVTGEDVVIIPAFGTTIETEKLLRDKGVKIERYNTTCPFVEKVWNRSRKLGQDNFTVIIHGKARHEETRATFSHSIQKGKSVIVKDINEAQFLAEVIKGQKSPEEFLDFFKGKYSNDFDPLTDLERIGVVNQTTMLASETQRIANMLREAIGEKYGVKELTHHYADTRDTLCYATNDNQDATYQLLNVPADLSVVVGGYNSSNTSHLVEILEAHFRTFFIKSPSEIIHKNKIKHFDIHSGEMLESDFIIPDKAVIAITSGASCPDTLLDAVILRIVDLFDNTLPVKDVIRNLAGS